MIDINKYRLTPDVVIGGMAAWGSIVGSISAQEDLMSMMSSYATKSWVSSKEFATKSWVSGQGFLTEHQPLKTINYQSIVGEGNINIEASIPDYYATKSWVSDQGYLTSESIPSDLATESWVESQGYLTTVPDSFATKSWVSGQGYALNTDLEVLESRVSVLESNYGDAIVITNNILS